MQSIDYQSITGIEDVIEDELSPFASIISNILTFPSAHPKAKCFPFLLRSTV